MPESFSSTSTKLSDLRFSTQNDFCRESNPNSLQFIREASEIMQARENPASPLVITELPCSEGKETWSLAAALAAQDIDFFIHAYDINPVVIKAATEPYETTMQQLELSFENWHLPPECLDFFEEVGEWSIQPKTELRRRVEFARLDIRIESPPPADVVISNNMLSYMLRKPVAQTALNNLVAGMRPDGLLTVREGQSLLHPSGSAPNTPTLAAVCGLELDTVQHGDVDTSFFRRASC